MIGFPDPISGERDQLSTGTSSEYFENCRTTTGQPVRRSSLVPRPPGAIWQEAFRELPTLHDVEDRTAIVMFELLDASAEQLESVEPWSRHPAFVKLRVRPVAIVTAIYRR